MSITRNTEGRFGELWRVVDEAVAEVSTYPAWKRGLSIDTHHRSSCECDWHREADRERLIDEVRD